MNSIGQFWQIVCQILEKNWNNEKAYFNNIQIDESKTKYNEKEILPEIQYYIFEYFQHIDCILTSIELAGAKISGEKSH